MKVLVLDEEFPFPTNTGKRTRSFNLYRRLAREFQICYLGYGERNSGAAKALRAEGMETVEVSATVQPKRGPVFYLRLLANLLSPLPYIVTSHRSRLYQDAVTATFVRFEPDLVVCEWTPYTIYARGLPSVKKMVSAHNVEADIWQRYHENETDLLRRWYIGKQWKKVELFERDALRWVDGAVAVSDPDLAQLTLQSPTLPIAVIPNGVDLDYFRPLPQPSSRRHMVFTGSMDWRPNQDAARYFVRQILPLLQRVRPELECTFVGRSPPPDVLALTRIRGVHVTGTVDDVRPYVERAAVYVVPLRIGGGSRLKILEALAMGRAVVSTTVGAEGLNVVSGHDILIADGPQAFADAVLRLLDEPSSCSKLGEEGRKLVEEQYGWDALAQRLGHFIRNIGGRGVPQSVR